VPAENVDLVRRLFEAVAEGGFGAGGAFLHPDFEMTQLPMHPEAGTYRGGPAAGQSMEEWMRSFEEFRWDAEEFIDVGDRVVVVVRERGRGRGGGAELDHRYGTVCTVRDGMVVSLGWFHDKDQALEAARSGSDAK
jgi:ketosteroid isomerase-like protein